MADDKSNPTDDVQEEIKEEPVVADESEQMEPEAPVDEAPEDEGKTEDTPAPQEEPAEQPPSRREQLRVQTLLKKYGNPSERVPQQQKRPDFRDKVAADEDVYKTLEDTTVQYAEDYAQRVKQDADFQIWHHFLKSDTNQVLAKYDVLNPDNKESFHPALADAMNSRYLDLIGFDPGDPQKGIRPSVERNDISYADFVEAEMEFADEIASHRVAATTQNIAKQAANAGLRPDGSSAKQPLNLGKAPEDMNEKELEAAIAATMPRDNRGRFVSQK